MGPSRKKRENAATVSPRQAPPRLGTVPPEDMACVWMRAGVLSYKLCDLGFDCESCPLDAALHGRAASPSAPWARGDWGPSGYRMFPHDRQFSPTHTWVLDVNPSSARVGLDALASWLLSEVSAVTLPSPDARIERGDALATLTVAGGKVVIASPIAGRVLARNQLVLSCPELVVSAPYGAGWLVELGRTDARKIKQNSWLLCGPEMEKLSRAHLHRFHRRTDQLLAAHRPRVGTTLADGGESLSDPRAMLGVARYLKLVQELLS